MNAKPNNARAALCSRCQRFTDLRLRALGNEMVCGGCFAAELTEREQAKMYRQAKRVEAPEWDASENTRVQRHDYWSHRAPAVAVERAAPSTKCITTCKCGIGHTLGSYRALPLIGATDRTEGFTAIHDETRACICGPLMVTTKRLLGGKP